MRLRYFGYHFENKENDKNERQSLLGILDAYCSYTCSIFKNSFEHNEEKLFLLKERENHYIFVKTKDTELVKAINKTDIKVDEITARLFKNESVGFAAHIYIEDSFLGFGSTHLAPSITAFSKFINFLFHKLRIKSHRFVISPLTTQITRKQAKSMKFIGATSLKVNRSSSVFDDFGGVLGLSSKEMDDLQSFEVIIKPLPNRNIKQSATRIIDLPEGGIERFQIRAKAELHDRLTDFRIENSLVLHDMVIQKEKEDIYTAIDRCIAQNRGILSKVSEYDRQNDVKETVITDIVKFHTNNNWPDPRIRS